MHTSNSKRFAAAFLAAAALALPAASAQQGGKPKSFPDTFQEKWEKVGTNVRINYRKNRGQVVLRFVSLDQLEQIYRRFFGS